MKKINQQKVTIKNERDLKAIAEQSRLYSIAIHPLTVFIVVHSALTIALIAKANPYGGFIAMGPALLSAAFALAVALLSAAFALAVHHFLFWSRFGPNWKLCYTCLLNGTTYYIVRDGARRLRVYYIEGATAYGVSTASEFDKCFVEWLKHEKPVSGNVSRAH